MAHGLRATSEDLPETLRSPAVESLETSLLVAQARLGRCNDWMRGREVTMPRLQAEAVRAASGSRRTLLIGAIAVLAGLLGLSHARYRPSIDQARARVSTGTRVASPAGPIEYALAGDGVPLLVVHGAGGGFDQGLDLGGALARSGFRVIAPSRFGYLGTPLPADASAAAQADAHAWLLDALSVERAAVLGVSAGGPSALQFALRHPARTAALVLLVPAVYAPRPSPAAPLRVPRGTPFLFDTALRSDFLFWSASKVARQTFVRAILGTPPELLANASAEERARLELVLDHILPVAPRRAGLVNDAAVISSLTRYELEKVGAPTLAISCADDLYGTFDGARYTAEHVPHARFVGYPSGGHMLVGHFAEATGEIASFLKGSVRF
jgi:pimeloyl-ACP methyl ester carboxylesterase